MEGTSIGVAPDAKWIAMKISDNKGYLSKMHPGFQWLLDPSNGPATKTPRTSLERAIFRQNL